MVTSTLRPPGSLNVKGLRPDAMAILVKASSIAFGLSKFDANDASILSLSATSGADCTATFLTASITARMRRIVSGRVLVASPVSESLKSPIFRTRFTSGGSSSSRLTSNAVVNAIRNASRTALLLLPSVLERRTTREEHEPLSGFTNIPTRTSPPAVPLSLMTAWNALSRSRLMANLLSYVVCLLCVVLFYFMALCL